MGREELKNLWTIKKILDWTDEYFKKKEVESSRLNAEILLAYLLKKNRLDLYLEFDRPLSSSELTSFRNLILKRSHHTPLSYITGEKNFMDFKFKISPDVYIPRPETEILVEEAIKIIKNLESENEEGDLEGITVVDLGTGCGNIAVSLAKELKKGKVYAVDVSSSALNIAIQNAKLYEVEEKVEFLQGDLFTPLEEISLEGKVDLIVSNPPYIPAKEIENLPLEVKKEPRVALEGGEDGLSFYKRIIQESPRFLKKGGISALEIGYNQAKGVRELLDARKTFHSLQIIRNYGGKERIILAVRG
ncbi:MAG: peptide chain release factor N(5)-glutamine methyltransferase [Candidatus Aerophobetes bacterium]|nr:peptide chain release factor N(5)-glutamine methyltransferase [Candidatus Aerophobetes bacterium]